MDAGCGDGLLTVEDLADALREAFLATDAHFMRSSSSQAGSTAVVALVTRTYVIVANAGDSRCVLWREGRVLPLSVDHKPDRPDELQRIKDAVRAG
jgi:serine/threonine protein phosphatase PrpC